LGNGSAVAFPSRQVIAAPSGAGASRATREHPHIEIEPGYLAGWADNRRNISGDRPGATGDIESTVAILRVCQLDESLRPGISKRRHDVAFVRLCDGFAGKLPA